MFEIRRKERDGELSEVGDDEAVAAVAPTDDGVGVLVFHHIVTFLQERRHRNGTIIVGFHHRKFNNQDKTSN